MRIWMTSTLLMVVLYASPVLAADANDFETAHEAVKNMKIGWNLGNTAIRN